MIIVLMGVSGAGKTTIGQKLALDLAWPMIDADALHSADNIAKMRRGEGLTDQDRAVWLLAVRARIDDHLANGTNLIVACSALKDRYRTVLGLDRPEVKTVYLRVPREVLEARLNDRIGHFAGVKLLESQLAALEEPQGVLVVDANRPVNAVVAEIITSLLAR